MTLRDELETVIQSDPVMAEPRMAGIIGLARAVADQADAQLANSGVLESRIIASYAGMLAQINRTIRDDRERRRKESPASTRPAGRLAAIQATAAATTEGAA
jgi:hypothetical protein